MLGIISGLALFAICAYNAMKEKDKSIRPLLLLIGIFMALALALGIHVFIG